MFFLSIRNPFAINFNFLLIISISFACALPVYAQSIKDDAHIFDKPDGNKTGSVKSGTSIKINKRQGFWVEVEAGSNKGWVKISQINMSASSGGGIALDTGRAGKGNIVSTSAARGLSAKDLLDGKPDFSAVAKLDGFSLDASAIASFRREANLQAVTEKISLTEVVLSKPQQQSSVEVNSDENEDKPKKMKKNDDW
jgi:hypothetical protein